MVVAAAIVSLWWENGISYDDNGLGSLTFLVMITLGLPFVAGVSVLAFLVPSMASWPTYLAVPIEFAAGSSPFFLADALSRRWLQRRARQQEQRARAAAATDYAVSTARGRRKQAP